MIALDILTDGFFAAVAGIGFGAISDPPLRAFKMIAILAALGHACRFCLMTYLGVDIATGSLFAGLVIGFGSFVVREKGILPDDGIVHSGVASHGSGKVCIQHGIFTYHVSAKCE